MLKSNPEPKSYLENSHEYIGLSSFWMYAHTKWRNRYKQIFPHRWSSPWVPIRCEQDPHSMRNMLGLARLDEPSLPLILGLSMVVNTKNLTSWHAWANYKHSSSCTMQWKHMFKIQTSATLRYIEVIMVFFFLFIISHKTPVRSSSRYNMALETHQLFAYSLSPTPECCNSHSDWPTQIKRNSIQRNSWN